jgi:glutaredoxin-related protein
MKGTPETPQCGFSRASIQILGMQGVDPKKFTAFNVLEDPELRQGRLCFIIELRELSPKLPGEITTNWLFFGIFEIYTGIKEYSDWPTIPQLYIDREFIGGCDILMSMHQNGDLAKLLEEKAVLVAAEE